MSRLAVLAFLASLAACRRVAVVVHPAFGSRGIHRLVVADFDDYPSVQGSGRVLADLFEKRLEQSGYEVIRRRAVDGSALKSLGQDLGAQAVLFGRVTDYADAHDETVLATAPQESNAEPLHQTYADLPDPRIVYARIGLQARLVAAADGEVLWKGAARSDPDADFAAYGEEYSVGEAAAQTVSSFLTAVAKSAP